MNFDRVSSFYDEEIVPVWGQPFAQILLRELSTPLRGSLLELGAGTGYLARHLVPYLERKGRIIALEPFHEMLEVARERAEEAIRQKKLFFQHHELEHLRFADGVFDLVYSNLGLYYIEHPDNILYEVLRVLKPSCKGFFTLPLRGSFTDFFGPVQTYLQEVQEFEVVEQMELRSMLFRSPEQALYLLRSVGFEVVDLRIHRFKMLFEDAHKLFQSAFIRYNFLEEWKPYLRFLSLEQMVHELTELFEMMRNNKTIEFAVQAGCLIGTKGALPLGQQHSF